MRAFAKPPKLGVLDTPARRALNPTSNVGMFNGASTMHEKYALKEAISSGVYGTVYKAENRATKQQVAVKKIKEEKLDSQDTEGISATTLREISILKELDHPNIIRLLDTVVDTRVWLVFELGTTDLRSHINSRATFPNAIPLDVVKRYTWEMLSACNFFHGRRIMHRDLKPANILLGLDGKLKVADFGLGRTISVPVQQRLTHEVLTLWYRAPEVTLGGPKGTYSLAVDIFSVGCILAEMSNKEALFRSGSEIEHTMMVFELNGAPTKETWPDVTNLADYNVAFPKFKGKDLTTVLPQLDDAGRDLFKNLICNAPGQRLSAKKAMRHPFLGSIDTQSPPSAAEAAARTIETQTPCCSQEFGQQSAADKGTGGPQLVTDTFFVRDSESEGDADDDVLLAACEATEKDLVRSLAVPNEC